MPRWRSASLSVEALEASPTSTVRQDAWPARAMSVAVRAAQPRRSVELCAISRACMVEGRIKADDSRRSQRTRLALFNDSALDSAGIGLKSTTRATISKSASPSQAGAGRTVGRR
eukprot:6504048-Prymnesium_polylepis.2